MPAGTPPDNPSFAVSIECVRKDPLICGVNVKHRDAVTLAAHEAEGVGSGAVGNFLARRQTKSSIVRYSRPLVGSAGERRNIVLGIDRLPFGKHAHAQTP